MREQLTRKDVEKIEQEIEHRKLVVRKEAIEAVKEARAQWDLSENFEYYAAKKHKNQNESRIRYLERMLKTASIVSDDSRDDEVGMDDIVEVLFEEDDEVEKYKLVTSIRGNSMENRVSIESPIGKALRGHRVGDRVEVKVNDDYSYYLVIKSIDKTGSEDEEIRGFWLKPSITENRCPIYGTLLWKSGLPENYHEKESKAEDLQSGLLSYFFT